MIPTFRTTFFLLQGSFDLISCYILYHTSPTKRPLLLPTKYKIRALFVRQNFIFVVSWKRTLSGHHLSQLLGGAESAFINCGSTAAPPSGWGKGCPDKHHTSYV